MCFLGHKNFVFWPKNMWFSKIKWCFLGLKTIIFGAISRGDFWTKAYVFLSPKNEFFLGKKGGYFFAYKAPLFFWPKISCFFGQKTPPCLLPVFWQKYTPVFWPKKDLFFAWKYMLLGKKTPVFRPKKYMFYDPKLLVLS